MNIQVIQEAISKKQIRITNHADEEAEADTLTFDEIIYAVFNGEIIERYPSDKPFPSCLIYGMNFSGEPIHTVWGYNPANSWAVLITVYRPDPARWIDWRTRRKS